MKNLFIDAPTVGSDHTKATATDHNGPTQNFEQQAQNHEQRVEVGQCYSESNRDDWQYNQKPKRKIKWGKIRRFFTAVVKPVLIFIPNVINAIANLRRAFATVKIVAA